MVSVTASSDPCKKQVKGIQEAKVLKQRLKNPDNLQMVWEVRDGDRDCRKFWVVVLRGDAVLPSAVHLRVFNLSCLNEKWIATVWQQCIERMMLTEYEVVMSIASWRGTSRVSGDEWQGASWKGGLGLFHFAGLDWDCLLYWTWNMFESKAGSGQPTLARETELSVCPSTW